MPILGGTDMIDFPEYCARVMFAAVCGLAIGIDGELKRKPLGARAYMLIASGAAALMVVTLNFTLSPQRSTGALALDPTRLIQGVVGGIGFLGAGAIMSRHDGRPLAEAVAERLGIEEMPEPAEAAMPTRDLPESPALSIIRNPPGSFAGRKIGVLVCDGFDSAVLRKLDTAFTAEGAMIEIVGPRVGGVRADDGTLVPGHYLIDGGRSVVFDAVALILTEEGADRLVHNVAARDFVSDAFAHCKFIGFTQGAGPLLSSVGVEPDRDDGLVPLEQVAAGDFVGTCRKLRLWSRERAVKA